MIYHVKNAAGDILAELYNPYELEGLEGLVAIKTDATIAGVKFVADATDATKMVEVATTLTVYSIVTKGANRFVCTLNAEGDITSIEPTPMTQPA